MQFFERSLGNTASLQTLGTFWVKQQTQFTLPSCRISTLRSFFLYYTTRWCQFSWEHLLASSNCLWYTEVSTSPARCCFRGRKFFLIFPSSTFFKTNLRARFTFIAHYKMLKKWSSSTSTIVALKFFMAYLKTFCLTHSSSEITRKRWHERNCYSRFVSVTLLRITSKSTCAVIFGKPCWVFLCCRKA